MNIPNDIVQANLYEGIGNANEYSLMPGVCILPLAEDPPTSLGDLATYSPVVITQLHAPYRIRKYNFSEQKQNNPPVVQTPQDVGAFKFIGGQLSFYSQFNTTWWNSDWTVTGTYLYVENCVSRPQDGFVLGSPAPFSTDPNVAAINQYLPNGANPQQLGITVGAISKAAPAAVAGYIYGQTLGGVQVPSQPTNQIVSDTPLSDAILTGGAGAVSGGFQLPLGIIPAWNYTMTAFYPGTLFNDQLANGIA